MPGSGTADASCRSHLRRRFTDTAEELAWQRHCLGSEASQPTHVVSDGRGDAGGAPRPDRSAIILAGGEGMRLRSLTRRIAGDERPKQFCRFVGGETLLDRTRVRVARSVRPDRTCLVLTRSHESFYAPLLGKGPLGPLVVQPCGRGTAPAILYGLLRVAETGPQDAVALFPSDHYVSDDARFMAHVEAALGAVEAHPDLVVLLGIEAEGPEVQYGWIEAGERVLDQPHYPVYQVRRFWEKPPGRWPRFCSSAAASGTASCWWPACRRCSPRCEPPCLICTVPS